MRDRRVWLFNSANTFSGNPKWLFAYVNRFRADIEAHWVCDSARTAEAIQRLGYSAITFRDPRGHSVQQRAGVFVVNQVKEQIPPRMDGALLLNLWHGVGVKSIERCMNEGYLLERIAKKYIQNNRYYRERQLFLVTSPAMEKHFTTQVGLDDCQLIRAGYPQNVYPRDIARPATFEHDKVFGSMSGAPTITQTLLYAPTPRRDDSSSLLLRAIPDLGELVETLRRNRQRLVLKMHPHRSDDPTFSAWRKEFADNPHLVFWDNADDVYEVFDRIDVAIVDYSSILYDLIAAGVKNFIRYVFDVDEDGRDVLADGFDYFDLSCGTVARSFPDLLDALGRSEPTDPLDLERLGSYFWSYDDGIAGMDRILDTAVAFEPRSLALPELHSFDVFDTVIHRRAVSPWSVFAAVRDRVERSEVAFPSYLTARYGQVRIQAEAAVRETRRKDPVLSRTGELEIQLDDIIQRIGDLFDLTAEQRCLLRSWELAEELDAVVVDVARVKEIRALLAEGHRVVLISDQYLPKEHVRLMLASADPVLAELPLYLSSAEGVQKSTKLLYLRVYRDQEYDFDRWVHHGDNVVTDVERASELGIVPSQVPATSLDEFETSVANELPGYDGWLLASILRDFRLGGSRTDLDLFAFDHVSSYLVPYVDWVVRDAARRGYRTLYFLSRDGYHLHRIAREVARVRRLSIRVRYIYGSRTAWRVSSQIDELDPDLFELYGDFAGASTPQALLRNAKLTAEQFTTMFPAFTDIVDREHLAPDVRADISDALRRSRQFHQHLLSVAATEREIVSDYLRQEIDPSEPFAFVEYWGRGYTQQCLVRLVEAAFGTPLEVPMYYARSINPTDGLAIRHNFTVANHSMLFIEAVFANLDHGPVLGYERRDGQVHPRHVPRSNDKALHDALERCLVEFTKHYSAANFTDPDRTNREWFRFGFQYYARNEGSPAFADIVAPLHDAVEPGRPEHEFAPPLTWGDIYDLLAKGVPFDTRSIKLSLARSSLTKRWLYDRSREMAGSRGRVALLPVYFVRDGTAVAARRLARRLTGR